MAARTLKIAVAVVVTTLLGLPMGADASHGRRCAGRPATVIGHEDLIRGTQGPDVILASGLDETIMALDGDDVVCAGGGNDVVYAGDGNDLVSGGWGENQLSGGAGDDILFGGVDSDVVMGQDGNDLVRGGPDGTAQPRVRDVVSGGLGHDLLLGGSGIDSLGGGGDEDTFLFSASAALVDLAGGVVASDTDVVDSISGVENVAGFTRFPGDAETEPVDPVIRGDATSNLLLGGAGTDHIYGQDGSDLLDGFCGTDRLDGGNGEEDVASFRFLRSVRASLESGSATGYNAECGVRSDAELVSLEGLAGSPGQDHLSGDSKNNYLYGYSGYDLLSGGQGDDVLDNSIDGGDALGGEGVDRCLNASNLSECEAGPGPRGPRRLEAVALMQRLGRLLEAIASTQQRL